METKTDFYQIVYSSLPLLALRMLWESDCLDAANPVMFEFNDLLLVKTH